MRVSSSTIFESSVDSFSCSMSICFCCESKSFSCAATLPSSRIDQTTPESTAPPTVHSSSFGLMMFTEALRSPETSPQVFHSNAGTREPQEPALCKASRRPVRTDRRNASLASRSTQNLRRLSLLKKPLSFFNPPYLGPMQIMLNALSSRPPAPSVELRFLVT